MAGWGYVPQPQADDPACFGSERVHGAETWVLEIASADGNAASVRTDQGRTLVADVGYDLAPCGDNLASRGECAAGRCVLLPAGLARVGGLAAAR